MNNQTRKEQLAALFAKSEAVGKKREELAKLNAAQVKVHTEWRRLEKVLPSIQQEARRLQKRQLLDDKPSLDDHSSPEYAYPTFEAAVEAIIATENQVEAHARLFDDMYEAIGKLERELNPEESAYKVMRAALSPAAAHQDINSGKPTVPIKREASVDDDDIGAANHKSEAKVKVDNESKPDVKRLKLGKTPKTPASGAKVEVIEVKEDN